MATPANDIDEEKSGRRRDFRGKKDFRKDRGYRMFEEEDSDEEVLVVEERSPSKMKKHSKPSFKFAKRDKFSKPKDKDKDKEKDKEKEERKEKEKEEKKREKEEKGLKKEKLKFKKKKFTISGSKQDITTVDPAEDGKPVFSVPLAVAVERSKGHDGIELPVLVRECIDYVEDYGLTSEGIYRISGVKSKIQALKDAYNRRLPVYLPEYEPNIVASLLKQYLRELPEPVLTAELLPKFEQACTQKNVKLKVEQFQELISQLPKPNRLLLSWMIIHMTHIIALEKQNKMSLQNVSIVLSPTMQISHRVLNVLFTYSKILFRDTVIKKYIPPLKPATSRWSLELPDSPTSLEEELRKQESLLNQLHEQLAKGKNTDMEEQLWEVQRVVTQLKRKLKHAKKTQEAAISMMEKVKEGDITKRSPSLKKEGETITKRSSFKKEIEITIKPAIRSETTVKGVSPKKEGETTEKGAKKEGETIEKQVKKDSETSAKPPCLKVKQSSAQFKAQPSDKESKAEADTVAASSEARDATAASVAAALPADTGKPAATEDAEENKDVNDGDNKAESTVSKVQTKDEIVTKDSEAEEKEAEEKEAIDTSLEETQTADSEHTEKQLPEAISEISVNKKDVSDSKTETESAPDQTVQEVTVTLDSETEDKVTEPPKAADTDSDIDAGTEGYVIVTKEDEEVAERQENLEVIPSEDKAHPLDKSFEVGEQSDTSSHSIALSQERLSEDEAVGKVTETKPVGAEASEDVSPPSELQRMSSGEEEEYDDLVQQHTRLLLEEEELLGFGDELRQKIETEHSEIERLHQEIADLKAIREGLYDSDDGSCDSSDENLEEEDLLEIIRQLTKQNKQLQTQNSELNQKVHEERQICLDVKVQIRLIQQRHLESSAATIDAWLN